MHKNHASWLSDLRRQVSLLIINCEFIEAWELESNEYFK